MHFIALHLIARLLYLFLTVIFFPQVRSTIAVGPLKHEIYGSGNLSSVDRQAGIRYHFMQIYGGGEPTVCEVYFLMSAEVRFQFLFVFVFE